MVPQFKYWICVSGPIDVHTPWLNTQTAGIIEGANDGRGRGRQGEL